MAKPQTPTKPPQPTVEAFDIESLKDLTTPLAEAQAAIADLERQREAVNHRRAEHDAERQRIAFAARAQGDQAASKRLSEMTTEAIRFDLELRDIEAALTTAQARFREAQEGEARHPERERAMEIRIVFERLKVAGQTIDDALAVVVAAGGEVHEATDQLHRLGCQSPSGQQILSVGERVLRAAIQQTLWARCIERVAPNERMSWGHVISQWERMLQNAIAGKLGEPQNEERAA